MVLNTKSVILIIIFFFITLNSYCQWNLYSIDDMQSSFTQEHNQWSLHSIDNITSNGLSSSTQEHVIYNNNIGKLLIDKNGSFRLLDPNISITNNYIQLDKINSENKISQLELYSRKWQFPSNASFLITEYPTENSIPLFDQARYYILSARNNSILEIQYIQKGYIPTQIVNIESHKRIKLTWDYDFDNLPIDFLCFNIYISTDGIEFKTYNASDYILPEYIKVTDKETSEVVDYIQGTTETIKNHYPDEDIIYHYARMHYESEKYIFTSINKKLFHIELTKSIGDYNIITSNEYKTNYLKPGTYYFYVTALDINGNESIPSNIVDSIF
ncbi:MAG: hypothetical protein ACOCV1_00775 [Bacillota bacterium]